MRNVFQIRELIDNQTTRNILNEIISPRLAKRGLIWNGKDLWFDQTKNSIRQVFKYSKLKGETGTFVWGVCLDFVPTIVSEKLKFHRTEKNIQPHLFEWTDEYSNSFCGGRLEGGITTHWGKQEAQTSISQLINKYEEKINNWFDRASTLEHIIKIAEQQITTGKSYDFHSPDQRLVLAFLQAKAKQFDNATNTINQLPLDNNLKELLLKQISKSG